MRIFNWVQNKLIGKQEKNRFDSESCSMRYSYPADSYKEEFSDWPEGLLAIGTFGNRNLKEESPRDESSEKCDLQAPSDFTIDEVIKLQKELVELLALNPKSSADGSEIGGEEHRASGLPLNRFLNHPDSSDNVNDGDLSPRTEIIVNNAKDVLGDNRNAIKRRSLSFLFKKFFLCGSGFVLSPNLRDPIPESRMEKIFRAMLHNKIHHQNSNPASSKKCLENKMEKGEDGQWDRTDSEYIVLEI